MASVIAFDVNETLLDMSALDRGFEQAFGDRRSRQQWFGMVLQLALTGGVTGEFVDFAGAQRAALQMLAAQRGRTLDAPGSASLLAGMNTLPAHAEVPEALERLRRSPLRLVALTQSDTGTADAQLRHANLRHVFDSVVGASDLGALKPAPVPYLAVAAALGVPAAEVRVVAAHDWDVSGALAAGCRAAFVARSGAVPSPIGAQPDIAGRDLVEVAGRILEVDAA